MDEICRREPAPFKPGGDRYRSESGVEKPALQVGDPALAGLAVKLRESADL
jgi:hypothetical protein